MIKSENKLNEELSYYPQLRLVGDNIEQGVYDYNYCISLAEEFGLDLVCISESVDPPVCKIIDYQKFLYQKKKKEKEAKNKSQTSELKDLRLSPTIGEHDLMVKVNQTKKFLSENNRVKITVIFTGREIVHFDLGNNVLNKFLTDVSDVSTIEIPVKLEGKKLSVTIKPKKLKN